MTSKEALEEINSILWEEVSFSRFDNLTTTIEKDLEILEIIKRWSFIQDNYKEGYGRFTQFICNIHTIGMKEDFEKVKEWLEK